jgi:hypothetical protein
MKTLSIRQPWAELILQGRKTIELRTWRTHYRGPILIHAGYTLETDGCATYDVNPAALARGAIVGTVEIVEMVEFDHDSFAATRDQHLDPGNWPGDVLGWRLADPQRLETPIPMRGRLGLFEVPEEVLEGASVPEYLTPPQPSGPQPENYNPETPFELHVVGPNPFDRNLTRHGGRLIRGQKRAKDKKNMLEPLAEVFGTLTDGRKRLGKRYDLKSVMTVIFLGLLSGENSARGIAEWAWEQRWKLSGELGLKAGRVPSLGTIQRVLRTIDVEELEQALSAWVQPLLTPEERERWDGIAMDGKTLRGSGSEERASLQLLSAFSHRLEAVLGQRAVADKTNEIPEARTLLKTLTLEGMLVTADALHTQRDTAQVILEKGGPT